MTIHILQHGLRNFNSHFYSETVEYLAALKDLGHDPVLYVHQSCNPAIVQELNAKPVFQLTPENIPVTDPSNRELGNYILCGEAFASVLMNNLPKAFSPNDLIFVPYGTQNEAYGLMRWLQFAGIHPLPKIAIFCHRPELIWNVSKDRTQTVASPSFWRWPAQFLKGAEQAPSTYLVTYSERLARLLHKLSELPVLVTGLTTSIAMRLEPALAYPKDIDIGIVGTFRTERGSALTASVLSLIDQLTPGLNYLVQTAQDSDRQALLAALTELGFQGHLEVAVGDLPTDTYTQNLVRCKLLVLPYAAHRYALRGSGVMSEAASYGIPVVVPSPTWMSDAIESGRVSGVTFEEFNATHIAQATVEALSQHKPLRDKAVSLAPAWREQNNARSNLKAIFNALNIPVQN
jgi:glycosyltransferase involved in cell wall biosynthesis